LKIQFGMDWYVCVCVEQVALENEIFSKNKASSTEKYIRRFFLCNILLNIIQIPEISLMVRSETTYEKFLADK
jgi:hypothetical protein